MNVCIDKTKKYVFRDKEHLSGSNLEYGLSYCAAGIVECFNYSSSENSISSGKDICVIYIKPWGEFCCCWRSFDEVILNEVSEKDYDLLISQMNELDC